MLVADPRAAPLLLVPAAVIFVAYRAYTNERAKHTTLEFLYDATRALTRGEPRPASRACWRWPARPSAPAAARCAASPPPSARPGRASRSAPTRSVTVDDKLCPEVVDGLLALVAMHPEGLI